MLESRQRSLLVLIFMAVRCSEEKWKSMQASMDVNVIRQVSSGQSMRAENLDPSDCRD